MSVSVLVMGRTKNGKSTFINALIGESILPMRAIPCTALVTAIEYGSDTEQIKVFYKGFDTPDIVPNERYIKEFTYPKENEWEERIYAFSNRIDSISHVEMQTKNPFFPVGFRLIDTPALSYERSYNRVTTEYFPRADAIVFLLNATNLFAPNEKEYIKENFAGKQLRNVFFVVNRINQLCEPLEEHTIPCMRSVLSVVFTDENGRFDENLFQKRVFYVDAYGALCARTGESYKVMIGKKEVEVPIAIEETGFPEFESALWQYLRSGARYGRE